MILLQTKHDRNEGDASGSKDHRSCKWFGRCWSMLKDVKCTFLGSRHFFRSNAPMSILVGKNCQVLLFRVFQDFSIAWSVSV